MRIPPLLLALTLSLAFALPAAAMPPTDPFAQGKALFDQGQYENAYAQLQKAFRAHPENLDISFYLGRAAFEMGDYEAAVMAYERILIMDPEANRVKLELARAHLRLGSREIAKQYFKEVLATNPPETVWQNIQKFLAAIEAAEQHHFVNGIVSVGYGWDDNVTAAPTSETINTILGNFPNNADRYRDQLYNLTAVVNHVYRLIDTPYAWKTSLLLYDDFYENQNTNDIGLVGLTSGLVRQGERTLWELAATGNHVDVEYDRYLASIGVTTNFTWIASQHLLLTAGATWQQKNYFQDGDKDADNLALRAGPVITFGDNRLAVSLSRETEIAAVDTNSYHRLAAAIRYDRQLPRDWAGFLSWRLQRTDYQERMQQLYASRRSDDLLELSAGISKRIWQAAEGNRNLSVQLSHTHTEAKSNINAFAYTKNVTKTSLTYAF